MLVLLRLGLLELGADDFMPVAPSTRAITARMRLYAELNAVLDGRIYIAPPQRPPAPTSFPLVLFVFLGAACYCLSFITCSIGEEGRCSPR